MLFRLARSSESAHRDGIMQHAHGLRAATALLIVLCPGVAAAGGFALTEHGGRGLGSAWAGEAAIAEDARTIYFNPAGMTFLPGTQVVGALDGIRTSESFTNDGSHLNPAVGGGPLHGNDGGNGGALGAIPSLYISHQLLDPLWVGLGVDAPFGLRTEWSSTWIGRYNAIVSDLKTVNINPSVAVRALPSLSLGAGLNVQYTHVLLTNDLDLGTLCVVQQGLPLSACEAVGLKPQGADGFVKISGHSWAVGWNVGLLWEPRDGTRLGLAYRSRIHHVIEGEGEFTVPQKAKALIKPTGELRDTAASAPADFPDSVSLAVAQQLAPRWTFLGDVTWTHWALFKNLAVDFANPKQTDITQPENWRNTLRMALGLRFDPNARWSFRTGFAYDETTITKSIYRDPRIPDSNRYWLAFGAGYQMTPWLRVDGGYAHIFTPDVATRSHDPASGNVLRGEFSGFADVIALQATYNFH
jgi:long-chain fatty acid transport protein